jgi:hypothetical protein
MGRKETHKASTAGMYAQELLRCIVNAQIYNDLSGKTDVALNYFSGGDKNLDE